MTAGFLCSSERNANKMISIRLVFHVGAAAYYIIISHMMRENMLKQKEEVLNDPLVRSMNSYSKRYLTKWTFALQYLYFLIAVGEEALSLFKGQDKLKAKVSNVKNYIFTVLAAPMALIVTLVFWSFWIVDRELILPSRLDVVIPPWVNHSLHTTTSLLVLIEIYLCHHKYPTFRSALLGISLYFICYAFCILGTYFETGLWLYPFITQLSWTVRACIGLGVYSLAIALYGLIGLLNKSLWDNTLATQRAPKKKHKKH